MKKYCILLSIFLASSMLFPQSKFGNATKEELEMTTYESDTTANAVVLRKSGRLKFTVDRNGSFQYEYTEQKKIKILKPEGLDYADNSINYYIASRNAKEEIKNLSGTTYNLENGKVTKTKLNKENIFDEDADGKLNIRKFTMPAAKVGSVIEYKYTIVSDFIYDLKDFYFQESLPIINVDFEVAIPEYFVYHVNNLGYIRLDKTDRKEREETFHITLDGGASASQSGRISCKVTDYIFEAVNVPPAKNEAFLWTVNDYISKVTFELSGTNFPWSYAKPVSNSWYNIDKELMDAQSFGKNLKHADWFKNEVQQGDITLEKATDILKLIKGKIQWNKNGSLISTKLKKSLEEGVGSSADMNFLLINALNAGGFEAFPVALSTRGNGRIPLTHPSISALNYVITGVIIDDKPFYTDASSKFSEWNLLPEKCLVSQARSMNKGMGEWVDLTKLATGNVLKHATLKIEDGKSILTVKETRGGNSAFDARNVYSNYESQEKFIQNIEENNGTTVSDFSLTGYDDGAKHFITEATETKDIELEDFIYLSPPISKLYKENPFKSETRMFPINFDYLLNYIQIISIDVPEGYEVAEIPKSEHIVLNDNAISYTYQVTNNNDKLNFQIKYQIKTLLLLPTEYDYVKDFFAKMINKNNEQIVLKKIQSSN